MSPYTVLDLQSFNESKLGQTQNLNSLSKSCKSIYSAIFPLLYENLELTIPQCWERLAYLEELLNPEANGLQYCRAMSVALPTLAKPKRRDPGIPASTSDSLALLDFKLVLNISTADPQQQSEILETLIRSLIRRLPRDCLRTFW